MIDRRMMQAPSGRLRRVALAATAAFALVFAAAAQAQQPTSAPATPKAQSKNSKSEPAPSTAPGAQPAVTQTPVPAAPNFVFSPWTKLCGKDGPESSDGKRVCAVITEARVEGGQLAATAALVEPADRAQNILRLTLPLGVRLPYGTRIIIDQGTPVQSGYVMCLAGCISDYEAGPDLVEKLKKGQNLTIQAINPGGSPISVDVPLEGFARAFDGPATDEKVVAAQQKKLEEQLKVRAEETRKKLEAQQGAGIQSGPGSTSPAAGK